MKFINRETHQAVRALVLMAEEGLEKTTVSELARRADIPRPFLRKIVQTLGKAGILESSRGKGGGFRLAVPPGRLPLSRLIEAFQGSLELHECLFRKKYCSGFEDCPLRRKVGKLEQAMLSELASTTVGSLAREFASARTARSPRKSPGEIRPIGK